MSFELRRGCPVRRRSTDGVRRRRTGRLAGLHINDRIGTLLVLTRDGDEFKVDVLVNRPADAERIAVETYQSARSRLPA